MTFLDPNSPTSAELETLRVECAKEAGWTRFPYIMSTSKDGTCKFESGECQLWLPQGRSMYSETEEELPPYSTSYDAILPEIQKLYPAQFKIFLDELYQISHSSPLFSKPWQLALAWLRVKQQNKKEA